MPTGKGTACGYIRSEGGPAAKGSGLPWYPENQSGWEIPRRTWQIPPHPKVPWADTAPNPWRGSPPGM